MELGCKVCTEVTQNYLIVYIECSQLYIHVYKSIFHARTAYTNIALEDCFLRQFVHSGKETPHPVSTKVFLKLRPNTSLLFAPFGKPTHLVGPPFPAVKVFSQSGRTVTS